MAENPRIEELRRRLGREPGSRLFAQLAEELRKEGNQAEAIQVARAGLTQQPNYPSARMTLGRALLDAGDLGGARVEFETVLRGAPDNILASRFLAECLEGLGDLGSALLQYRAAQRLAPADKYLESQVRALELKLSAPTTRKSPEAGPPVVAPSPAPPVSAPAPAPPPLPSRPVAEAPPPPVAPAPRVPAPPPRASTVTAEFDTPAASRAPAATATARPPLPLPPEPEAPPAPTLVEESFDLEAPFNAPTQLRGEESPTLPGRALPEEPESAEAPTLPATPVPAFDPIPLSLPPLTAEPLVVPEAPRVPVVAPIAKMPAHPPPPIAEMRAPAPSIAPPPAAEPPVEAPWRAPAPPRARGLDETQEIGNYPPAAAPPPSDSVDTTRVPVVVFPIPAAPAKPGLDAIRLEWAPATPAPPAPVVVQERAPEPEPLLSPTLAELYFGQGALDKAVEVYEQLLGREPANERHRARLAEIRRAASPPAPADDQRAARRQTIEAQIARLEQLLALVKRA